MSDSVQPRIVRAIEISYRRAAPILMIVNRALQAALLVSRVWELFQ